MQMMSWQMMASILTDMSAAAAVYQPSYMAHSFWLGAEMEMETVLNYYSIPTVSARNALFHLLIAGVKGFTEEDQHCLVHPNALGHRCSKDIGVMSSSDVCMTMRLWRVGGC